MRVDEQGNETEVTIRSGEILELTLAENRSTGFRWNIVSTGAPVLELESESFATAPHRPGAPGRHTWLLRARTAGEAALELVYLRSWENAAPVRRFSLMVKCSAA